MKKDLAASEMCAVYLSPHQPGNCRTSPSDLCGFVGGAEGAVFQQVMQPESLSTSCFPKFAAENQVNTPLDAGVQDCCCDRVGLSQIPNALLARFI